MCDLTSMKLFPFSFFLGTKEQVTLIITLSDSQLTFTYVISVERTTKPFKPHMVIILIYFTHGESGRQRLNDFPKVT
jgi:hypothetical protein